MLALMRSANGRSYPDAPDRVCLRFKPAAHGFRRTFSLVGDGVRGLMGCGSLAVMISRTGRAWV